jgi:acetyl-CoA acetyltransferase
MAALLAGFPASVAAVTLNRLCASGLAAIKAGEGDIYIGGGVESMTRSPYAMMKTNPEWPFGNGVMWDTTIGWRFPNKRLWEMHGSDIMRETAENVYEMTRISREEQDRFSLESHRRALATIESGKFAEEIVPVPVPQKKGAPVLVGRDENPRTDTPWKRSRSCARPSGRAGRLRRGIPPG